VTKKLSAREKRLKAQARRLRAKLKAERAKVRQLKRPKYVELTKPEPKLTKAQKVRRASRTKLLPQLEKLTTKEERKKFSVEQAAKWTQRSPETIRKWIHKGNTPKPMLDRIRANLTGDQPLPETWAHGDKNQITAEEQSKFHSAMRGFIQAKHKKDKSIPKKYEEFYSEKKKLRRKLSKKAWDALMHKLGKSEGLDEQGAFSILRFMLS
jgi:hypothetical protein